MEMVGLERPVQSATPLIRSAIAAALLLGASAAGAGTLVISDEWKAAVQRELPADKPADT